MIVKKGKCIPTKECGTACCSECTNFDSETGLCKIYPNRPFGCRVYPHNPMALEKGCSFYFLDTETLEIITPSNVPSFSEDKRRKWLELLIEKSEDE